MKLNFFWSKLIYLKPFRTTPDTKLRWFQFRILHNIIAANSFLAKIRVSSSDKCGFCNNETETIPHLFWHCSHVQNFWKLFSEMLKEKCPHSCNLNLNLELVIFGVKDNFISDETLDLILLLAKFYVYKCKLAKNISSLIHFKRILQDRYYIEKNRYYARSENLKFYQKWMQYHALFSNTSH